MALYPCPLMAANTNMWVLMEWSWLRQSPSMTHHMTVPKQDVRGLLSMSVDKDMKLS